MKTNFNFHFYSRIMVGAVFVLGAYLLYQSIQTTAITLPPAGVEVGGWAWSENIGWVSLNCNNDFDGDGTLDDGCAVPYRLEVMPASYNSIAGCAWAGSTNSGDNTNMLGWICFSNNNPQPPPASFGVNAPAFGVPVAVEGGTGIVNSLDVNSFASIVSFEDSPPYTSDAWKLGFPKSPTSSPGALQGCFNCYVEEIKTSQPIGKNTCINDIECIIADDVCVVTETNNNCENCLEYFYRDADNLPKWEKGDLEKVLAGYTCSDCDIYDVNNSCELNSYNKNLNSCNSCVQYYQTPGVIVDTKYGTIADPERALLCGWGWNNDNSGGNDYGIGWLQFSPRITTSSNPYISVEKGNIYSRGSIFSKYAPPFGRYNASYLIEAGGTITNFISSSTISGLFQGELPNRPLLSFPDLVTGGRYKNALGTIDINGLITPVYTEGTDEYNKYGSLIKTNEDIPFTWPPDDVVHYNDTDYIMSWPIGIPVGQNSEKSTAVVIIDGDFYIGTDGGSKNIVYQPGVPTNLKHIASVVWIVKGDIRVHPDTTQLSGTFIVLGDDSINDCSEPIADGCGQFISCYCAAPPCDCSNQLTVYGSVMAKSFDLGRTYYSNEEPAELFINDGRLQANPPSGFSDFSRVVPRFSENPN